MLQTDALGRDGRDSPLINLDFIYGLYLHGGRESGRCCCCCCYRSRYGEISQGCSRQEIRRPPFSTREVNLVKSIGTQHPRPSRSLPRRQSEISLDVVLGRLAKSSATDISPLATYRWLQDFNPEGKLDRKPRHLHSHIENPSCLEVHEQKKAMWRPLPATTYHAGYFNYLAWILAWICFRSNFTCFMLYRFSYRFSWVSISARSRLLTLGWPSGVILGSRFFLFFGGFFFSFFVFKESAYFRLARKLCRDTIRCSKDRPWQRCDAEIPAETLFPHTAGRCPFFVDIAAKLQS